MREVPDYFWKWTEIAVKTGKRLVKPNTPKDILERLTKDEKDEYEKTGRRVIINIDVDERSKP